MDEYSERKKAVEEEIRLEREEREVAKQAEIREQIERRRADPMKGIFEAADFWNGMPFTVDEQVEYRRGILDLEMLLSEVAAAIDHTAAVRELEAATTAASESSTQMARRLQIATWALFALAVGNALLFAAAEWGWF